MRAAEFDFDLPDELIAQDAVARGASRLLVLDRDTGSVRHTTMRDMPAFLRAGDLLVVNDTRVFPARLLGHRVPSGGAVECLLLGIGDRGSGIGKREADSGERRAASGERTADSGEREADSGERTADSGDRSEIWEALMHPGQKLKPGARVVFENAGTRLHGEVLERLFFGRRRIRLTPEQGSVAAAVDALGHIPLPPYIHRDDTPADRERYQTVFAAHRGSIAAPTAGLHFDAALLDAIDRAGVERTSVTLHVGYGTFKPVRAEHVEDHVVDPEPYEIPAAAAQAINRALDDRRRVIAVGTTTTRALEDAARRAGGRIASGAAQADLFIHPGFEFRVISGLLTNFHLPKSSLLMLVSAFAGTAPVLAAYREAVAQRYRFYSYGDAMLIVGGRRAESGERRAESGERRAESGKRKAVSGEREADSG